MNIKVTVELSGAEDDSEIGRRLRLLIDGSSAEGLTAQQPSYSAALAAELVDRITDDARTVLRFIAENAPRASMAAVQKHLGIDGIQLGGVMASFGFAEKAGIPRPFRKDDTRRLYIIEPEAATTILAALNDADQAQAA
jgi:hypothetical protein